MIHIMAWHQRQDVVDIKGPRMKMKTLLNKAWKPV